MRNKTFFKLARQILPVVCLLPNLGWAQVTGTFDTTALTRLDVTAIKAPGLKETHTVDIYDGSYGYKTDGSFAAADVTGTWSQAKKQYTIKPNRVNLENQYRLMLENSGFLVTSVKLVKNKLTGLELDNGILGTESYEYRLDITDKNTSKRQVLKVLQTVQVAGQPASTVTSAPVKQSAAVAKTPQASALAASVAAVRQFMDQQ